MRVAIVADWLVAYAGGERVLEQMLKLYPSADLFSLLDYFPDEHRGVLNHKPVKTSFLQKMPFSRSKYRNYLPLMPLAIEQFDMSSYDLVLSSSSAMAKGVITGPEQCHICYCHSPIRYAWDLQHQYLNESGLQKGMKSWFARYFLHRMRQWDIRTANGVDHFIANSHFIAKRIWKVYRRQAMVIYPPVDVENFTVGLQKEDYYFTCSRMVPYKKIRLIVEAFNQMPDKQLVVIGDGPEFAAIKKVAGGNTILMGHQPFDTLRHYMQKAKAFVFAALEDFGIAPVEAQACGVPVIAYGKGGAAETVRGLEDPKPTGLFFYEQTVPALCDAIHQFESVQERMSADICRDNALRFSMQSFLEKFSSFVEQRLSEPVIY